MEAKAKERLHELVNRIPEGEVHAAERYLEYLAWHGDPLLRKLFEAPYDDEPTTEEEETGVREAWDDYKAGRVHTLEEVKKEFGP
jgi:hypothetical protein